MGANLTQETLELIKAAQAKPNDALAKSISTSTGLVAFDLQAPAKNLYPVNTPIRNRLPRVRGKGGTATNWRIVSALAGSGYDAMGWVPEGQRAARMSYTTSTKAASYVTLGEEDQASYEAINAAEGFEDIRATMTMRLLQKAMLKEENGILGGNASLALGTTPTPSLSVGGTTGTIATGTVSVICVALTYEGFRTASLANGVPASQTVTGADGLTFTLSGGSAQKSANATIAITLGQVLSASVAAVRGAVGYAWYAGAAGSERLEAITTFNSVALSAFAGTGQAATALPSADNSKNTLACDGLLTNAFNAANGAYFKALATGTPGTGTPLTASGRGSIIEIDTMLQSLWDSYQVSPTVLFMNSQQIKDVTNKVLTNGSAPLLQFFADPAQGAQLIAAGGGIQYYYNPFAMGTGVKIPVLIHPTLPNGTILAHCENLPAQYISNDVPNVAEVHTRKEFYQIDWPIVTRQQQVGVYVEEVLAVYAPFALGVLTNIAPG